MDNDTERRNDGNKSIMDEVERKDVTVRSETSNNPSTVPKMKQVGVDTRSREAFELLKLGEAICNLQVDQRKMRLNAEDMRFERDRYKASAAAFQDKLAVALNENARLRDLREVLRTMSLQNEAAVAQRAQTEGEYVSLTSALHASEQRAEDLRLNHEQVTATLRATEEQLNQAIRENDRLSNELADTKAQMERMRQAFIDITRDLIAEAKMVNAAAPH